MVDIYHLKSIPVPEQRISKSVVSRCFWADLEHLQGMRFHDQVIHLWGAKAPVLLVIVVFGIIRIAHLEVLKVRKVVVDMGGQIGSDPGTNADQLESLETLSTEAPQPGPEWDRALPILVHTEFQKLDSSRSSHFFLESLASIDPQKNFLQTVGARDKDSLQFRFCWELEGD